MERFAKHLALHFDAPRTRHSYYRQMRLIHEFCQCDPTAITEEMLRDYFLHVKTVKRWKSKTIRQAAAAAKTSSKTSEPMFAAPPSATRASFRLARPM